MVGAIRNFKPGVARKIHILSAALLWTILGGVLLYRGVSYLHQGERLWLVLPGIAAGTVKSYLILDRAARRGLQRIRNFSDNTCIGAVYSWKTWLIVLAMGVFGIVMRHLSLPFSIIGILCVAIGWSLVFSSRHGWRAWFNWKTASH